VEFELSLGAGAYLCLSVLRFLIIGPAPVVGEVSVYLEALVVFLGDDGLVALASNGLLFLLLLF
jgi:hypothetical protein